MVNVFAGRQVNGISHALARATLSYASSNIFYVIRNYIAIIIINEMP
jgi:hypothetical protein